MNLKTECYILALVELLQNLHPYPLMYVPLHVNKFLDFEHGGESLDYRPLMNVVNQHEIAHQYCQ